MSIITPNKWQYTDKAINEQTLSLKHGSGGKIQIATSVDLDLIETSCIVFADSSTLNRPDIINGYVETIVVEGTNLFNLQASQTFEQNVSIGSMTYKRFALGGTWGSWKLETAVSSDTIWVSVNGDDNNIGTRSDYPFQTLDKAFDYLYYSSSNYTQIAIITTGTYTHNYSGHRYYEFKNLMINAGFQPEINIAFNAQTTDSSMIFANANITFSFSTNGTLSFNADASSFSPFLDIKSLSISGVSPYTVANTGSINKPLVDSRNFGGNAMYSILDATIATGTSIASAVGNNFRVIAPTNTTLQGTATYFTGKPATVISTFNSKQLQLI